MTTRTKRRGLGPDILRLLLPHGRPFLFVDRVLGWVGRKPPATNHFPVAQKDANPFGLHDVHGNVWEWCEDAWHGNYGGAPTDGAAWRSEATSTRVSRGGGWRSGARYARSAYRNWFDPGLGSVILGFRPARSVAP